jgi:hypothetical protein
MDLIVALWRVFAPMDLVVALWRVSAPMDLVVVIWKIFLNSIKLWELSHRLNRIMSLLGAILLLI